MRSLSFLALAAFFFFRSFLSQLATLSFNMHFASAPRFISGKYNLFVARVALSKLTLWYFIFSVAHCVIQVALQGHAFTTNAKAATFLWDVVAQGNAKVQGILTFGNGLQVCDTVEDALSDTSCEVVWDGSATKSVQSTPLPSMSSTTPAYSSTSTPSHSSLPPATTYSTPTVTPTSITPHLSSSSLLATPPPTSPGVPLPTTSTGLIVLIGSGTVYEEPPVVILNRRSQESRGIPQGEGVVRIQKLGDTNSSVVLDHRCLVSLNWPAAALDNTKREDIVFIAFQFWVLGISIVAILNESIPHIIASLFTHMVATGWGVFQIVHTNQFRSSFSRLITNGACGVNILPTYWGPRRVAEIASLALNAFALLIAVILSWRLTKAFGWRTFKRLGASMKIRTQYRAVLILSITIQLAFFFIVASAGLWLDQLINGVISQITEQKVACEVVTILILALLIPWLALGWISVRKEKRTLMGVFLGMSFLYLANWGAMFVGASFRWTFLEWRFFSLMASASVALTLSALITGIVCRMGFGQGLPEHLSETRHMEDEDTLFSPPEQDDASEISIEKVEFPPLGYPVPTFSATFRSNDDDEDPPEEPRFPTPQMGPRFFSATSVPFDQRAILKPVLAHTREQPPTSTIPHMYQYNGGATNHSRSNSDASVYSGVSNKRWVVE